MKVEQILLIFFGWILGIVNYFVIRWTEKRQKIQDFRIGLSEELKEVLPVLAGVRLLIQQSLGELDRKSAIWIRDAISIGRKEFLDPQMIEALEKVINLTNHEIQIASKLKKDDPTAGKGFKKYNLPFLDTNINMVPLLDIELQGAIFKVRRYLHMLEQEVDMYNFFFRKTFDPASMEVNHKALKENQYNCYKAISYICFGAVNEVSSLIKKLETQK